MTPAVIFLAAFFAGLFIAFALCRIAAKPVPGSRVVQPGASTYDEYGEDR